MTEHLDGGTPQLVSLGMVRGQLGSDLPGASLSVIVDAYERLGTRVLGRLRDLREDVDADLDEVGAEVAALRTAVEDIADRVQLRQLRSSIDELRSDLAGLRRAVLEWPELERTTTDGSLVVDVAPLASEIAALRDAVEAIGGPGSNTAGDAAELSATVTAAVQEQLEGLHTALARTSLTGLAPLVEDVHALHDEVTGLRGAMSDRGAEPDDVRAELVALRDEVARLDPAAAPPGSAELARELADVRGEMVALRRRIALKAAGSGLSPEDLQAIAEAVTARLLETIRPA